MTESGGGQERLRLVVDWFSHQKALKIPQELKAPLRQYLTDLPASERNYVVPVKKRKRSKLKVVRAVKPSLNSFEEEALKYLRTKQNERGDMRIDDSRVLRMVNALASVCDSKLSEEKFWNFLTEEAKDQVLSITTENNASLCSFSASSPRGTEHPLQRLLSLYRKIELSTEFHTLAKRMLTVLIHYQYKLINDSGIDSDARQRQMLQRTGCTVESTKDLRKRATGWLRFMSVFGVGALAMTQAQADYDFELQVNVDFLLDCRNFLEEKHVKIWEHITNTNWTVGNIFLRLNMKYAHDGMPLMTGLEKLSVCLREAFATPAIEPHPNDSDRRDARAERQSDSPLSAFAAIAVAAAAEGDLRDTQAEQQFRARGDGLIAGKVPGLPPTQAGPASGATFGQQDSWQMHTNQRSSAIPGVSAGPCMPPAATGQAQAHEPGSTSGNSQHGLAVDTQAQAHSRPGPWNEGLISGRAPGLVANEMGITSTATHGQHMQPSWQTYGNQNCPQQVPVHFFSPGGAQDLMGSEAPIDDTFNPSQNHFDQSDVAIRQDGGGFWPGAWLDDLAQAGGFST